MIGTPVSALAHRPELAALHHFWLLGRRQVGVKALHFHRFLCSQTRGEGGSKGRRIWRAHAHVPNELSIGRMSRPASEGPPRSLWRTPTLDLAALGGGLTSSSSISDSARFSSGLGTPSSVTMNLGLGELSFSLLAERKKPVTKKEKTPSEGRRQESLRNARNLQSLAEPTRMPKEVISGKAKTTRGERVKVARTWPAPCAVGPAPLCDPAADRRFRPAAGDSR